MARDSPPLEGLDLNLLVTLRALLREASVSRAAEQLGQTQPTVSRSLSTLRGAFDDQLLVRSGRGMALTSLAHSLRTPVERGLASLDRLRAVGEFDPTRAERVFRVVIPDIIGSFAVPTLTRRFLDTAPGVSLQIFGGEREVLRALLNDEIDVVLGARALEHPELYTRSLRSEGLGWSVIHGPLNPAFDRGMDLDQWLRSEHIQLIPEGRPDGGSLVDQLLSELGVSRVTRVRVTYLAALKETLIQTPCVTSLPSPTAHWLADRSELRVSPHPLGKQLPPLKLRMTWHETHHADPGHAWLRSQLSAVISETS